MLRPCTQRLARDPPPSDSGTLRFACLGTPLKTPGRFMTITPWTTPVGICHEHPKLFAFRGQPLVLVTSTEHYGAVMNRPFRYDRYLADMAVKGMTLATVLNFDLPNAPFRASTYSPTSGLYSPGTDFHGGHGRRLDTPSFEHDLVVRLRREI